MNDPRQKQFMAAMGSIKKACGPDLTTNDMDSIMTASAVNLGRLQDTIKELMEKGEIHNEQDITDFVLSSVQRPKQIQVGPWQDSFNKCTRYKIELVTKDDYGYYEYVFYTRLTEMDKRKRDEIQTSSERGAEDKD